MHPKVLSADAWRIVRKLKQSGFIHGWILAGGTGLALQLGHRYSEDLDLFRAEAFESDSLLTHLAGIGSMRIQNRAPSTLHVLIESVRFSFLRCQPPLIFEGTLYRGVQVADPRDIAVMKLVAIGGHGSRKDFIDLYFYLEAFGGLDSVLSLMKKRFVNIDYNAYHLIKSLVYFEDAENEPMPNMIKQTQWTHIKAALIKEVRRLGLY
jgi:hypothetical protein